MVDQGARSKYYTFSSCSLPLLPQAPSASSMKKGEGEGKGESREGEEEGEREDMNPGHQLQDSWGHCLPSFSLEVFV